MLRSTPLNRAKATAFFHPPVFPAFPSLGRDPVESNCIDHSSFRESKTKRRESEKNSGIDRVFSASEKKRSSLQSLLSSPNLPTLSANGRNKALRWDAMRQSAALHMKDTGKTSKVPEKGRRTEVVSSEKKNFDLFDLFFLFSFSTSRAPFLLLPRDHALAQRRLARPPSRRRPRRRRAAITESWKKKKKKGERMKKNRNPLFPSQLIRVD